jgi:nucleolar protein 14
LPYEEEQFTEKCNVIGKHIIQLSEEFVPIAADYALNRIKDLRASFSKTESSVMMPRAPELAFFKTLLLTFPGSDLFHPIITPLILLMAQYLEMASVKSDQDLLSGVKLCEYLFIVR